LKKNKVFIATSLDGYIADKNGGIAWLDTIPELNSIDSGYESFMSGIDALVMGRSTYDTICEFDIPWPYNIPVFVMSRKLNELNGKFKDDVHLIKGSLSEILKQIHKLGYHKLYIDGGKVIQSFLAKDLIDEMIITIIPVLLGDGIPLFSKQSRPLEFECIKTKHYLNAIVQNHFKRKR